VGLLAMFATTWSGGARGFGLTTAAVGLGALLAPVCCATLGVRPTAQVPALVALAIGLGPVVLAPHWAWTLLPLAVVGVAATQVECAVTTQIQHRLPSRSRASALGITDTAMVAANLVGAATAPFLVRALGPSVFLTVLAGLALAVVPLAGPEGWAEARGLRIPPV
jgi:hypothetical protein